MNRRDRRAGTRTPQAAPNSLGARHPTALFETGLRHLRAGRHLDAQTCCQQALAINGDHADSLHLMGLVSLHAGQHDHAMQWIVRAIRQDPRPEFLASLGNVLQQQGKHQEALQAFDKAVQLKPDDAELWRSLGNVLLDLQRYDHALLSLQHVLKLDPRHQDAAYKSGVLLHQFGRFEEALAQFDRCDELLPNHAPTLQGRVRVLFSLRRHQEALTDARRVYKLDPANAGVCNYIGACLQLLGQEQEALLWFDKALVHLPDVIEILNNKAFVLAQLQRFDEAFAFYDHIRTVHPNDATMRWNLALLQMLTGDFEAGWAGREARWTKAEPFPYPKFSQPIWLGEGSIDGKTILIHVDEGLGDTIQFARYVPMVAALGARVVLVVERPAHSLLSGLSGVSQCLAFAGGALPAFDLHCPMGSLPLVFATRLDTIPATPSYLPSAAAARVQAWEQRLGPHDKLRVGLVWSGSLTHKNDVNRSTSLRQMSWLLDVDATFVSLQKDPRPHDKALLAHTEIVDLTADLTDLAETAALIGCLDLVITVDTSVAHLAGALGCPTWILLPWTPDYRWLLGRDDSPWYPSVRLFRQDATRDYGRVFEQVRTALLALVAAR